MTTVPDSFFALASIVADEMYASPIPLVTLSLEDFARLQTGQRVQVWPDGTVEILT
jgi:predicted aconitase with swiveling domain